MNKSLGLGAKSSTDETASANSAVTNRSEFLSGIGHEIRGPLSSIIAHAEVLRDGVYGSLNEAQKKVLISIQDSAAETLALITDWIALELLEDGCHTAVPVPCLVREVCDQCIDDLRKLARFRDAGVVVDIKPPDLRVAADMQRLKQAITGLVSGAVLSTPPPGQIRLHIAAADKSLQITASGVLENPSKAPHLERMRRLNPIGLALLQKIVVVHGGALTFAPASDTGLLISLDLPLDILPAEVPPPAPATSSALATDSSAADRSKTILLADDQPALVSVVCHYLESLGLHVIVAHDGLQAVQQVLSHRPLLVLMDVRMPVLDGLEAIRQIRASTDPVIRSTPIISLSGLAASAEKEKCLAAGATAYLSKPFGVKELDWVVSEFVKPRLA